jgi:hypothetical protein
MPGAWRGAALAPPLEPIVIAKSALIHLASFFASGAEINGTSLADPLVESHFRADSGTLNRQRTAQ